MSPLCLYTSIRFPSLSKYALPLLALSFFVYIYVSLLCLYTFPPFVSLYIYVSLFTFIFVSPLCLYTMYTFPFFVYITTLKKHLLLYLNSDQISCCIKLRQNRIFNLFLISWKYYYNSSEPKTKLQKFPLRVKFHANS